MQKKMLQLTKKERETVARCSLFTGLEGKQLDEALAFFHARRYNYQKGEFLLRLGEPLPRFGLLLEGELQTFIDEHSGHRMVMAQLAPGDAFGESLSYLQVQESPVFVSATVDSQVLLLSPHILRELPANLSPTERQMMQRFTAWLAQRTLDMNSRIRILSQRTLRDKILTLLTPFCPEEDQPFTIPFNRSAMADYLGVDRSALSRELSNLRQQGVLDYRKNQFILHIPL